MNFQRSFGFPTLFRPEAVKLSPHHAAWPQTCATARALTARLTEMRAAHRRLLSDIGRLPPRVTTPRPTAKRQLPLRPLPQRPASEPAASLTT